MRTAACVTLLCALAFAAPASATSGVQGDQILNFAAVGAAGLPAVVTSSPAAVTVRIPTPATIELLQYAPGTAGARPEALVPGVFRSGAGAGALFTPLPLPKLTGAPTALALPASVPLLVSGQFHAGDPVFIRLTDRDQNMDRNARETVLVSITDDLTGDAEVVRLTEDGPDTGVFAGYIPSVRTAGVSQQYDGVLQLIEKSVLTASYVDPVDPGDTASARGVLDPSSRIFDSRTGKLVDGAEITVVDVSSGRPATLFSDDGVSSFPSTVVSGRTATDGAGRVYSFGPGEFRFPFLRPGTYRYDVKPPAGYTAPSKVADAALQAQPGAPFTLSDPGSRGGAFPLDPGPIAHFDIPVDPAAVKLWVEKTAAATRVGTGDFLSYQIAVTNLDSSATAGSVQAVDTLPVGFRYKAGSAQSNGSPAPDPSVSKDGRTLTFALGDLAPSATTSVRFLVQVGAGAAVGADAVNVASATSTGGGTSNVARATVKVGDDFFSNRAFILGRVTTGECIEQEGVGEQGVEGLRVLLEDGTFAFSDKQGLFHFEGVRKGLHVVQLDLDSLPEGLEPVSCTRNDRFAGRAFSQFVEVQGNGLWRADFHLQPRPKLAAPPPPPPAEVPPPPSAATPPGTPAPSGTPAPPVAPPPGELALSLTHRLGGRLAAEFQAELRGTRAPLTGARLAVTLPEGLGYEPGSSAIGGTRVADPVIERSTLTYPLGDVVGDWSKTLTFRARAPEGAKPGDVPAAAVLSGLGANGARVQTQAAENVLRLGAEQHAEPIRLVIRPHFPSFGTELSPADKKELEQMARRLAKADLERIVVIGHTDHVPIAARSRKIFADNAALSLGRARSVGHFLLELLRLREDQLETHGKGEHEPVADNRNEKGRAMNRRAVIHVYAADVEERAVLVSVKDHSGVQRADAPAAPAAVAPAASIAAGGTPAPVVIAAASAPVALLEASLAPGGAPAPVLVPAASATAHPVMSPVGPAAMPSGPMAPPAAVLTDGLISPVDGALLADRINAIQLRLASHLTAALAVDGKEVDASRIGYKGEDHDTKKTIYTYVGVDFGEKGTHTLTLTGTDPFGNVRVKETATILRTGEIASARLVSAEGNIADGKTPVRARIELLDASGDPIRGSTRLELRGGNLTALRRTGEKLTLEDQAGSRSVLMNKDGWILFQPVTTSGSYHATLAYGGATVEVETWAEPKMRDWILVGLAEGTAGYDIARDNLESLQAGEAHQDFYDSERVAFYAKGQIQGKWLVTMAYDSARSPSQVGDSLFQAIDPQTYFTLYGDAGQQGYDAASARKLYVKIERQQFYAMFGDYDTGLTVTELSRYSRKLNGVKTELQTRNAEVNAFLARTDKAFARDEIPGDGTSGLYRLSRGQLTVNSETVTLLTRDRFRSEVVVESRTLTRFTDYSIDYDRGTIFFREPIPSRDFQFNPVAIVVEYETGSLGGEDYTLGGRAGLKLFEQRLRAGITAVHEGQGTRQNDLYGADLKLQLGSTRVRGEFAHTDSRDAGASVTGDAFLAELSHNTRAIDAKLYLREQQGGFGLGQQSATEQGTRKLGAEAAYHFSDQLSLSGQGYRQDTFSTGTERLFGETRLGYASGPYGGYLGVLDASDRLGDGSRHESGQLTAGGKLLTAKERLLLGLDYSQSAWGTGSSDFPSRIALRAEYKLTDAVTAIGAEELTWGSAAATTSTRIGLRSTLWQGGSLTTSMERDLNENSSRVFGNIGLRQLWQVSEAWKLDGGLERSQTVQRAGFYRLNPSVPQASGNVGGEDFTAVSIGANYQVKRLVWDSRAELRVAETDRKWSLLSGVVAERDNGWAWSGRGQYLGTSADGGAHTTSANLRLGLVYRPPRTRWILLNRLDWFVAKSAGASAGTLLFGDPTQTDSWRVVDNFLANYRPRKELQLSFGYGGKYGRELVAGRVYQGYTDQESLELRQDLTERWDVGLRASVLRLWGEGQFAFSGGPSVGFSPATNLWLGVGFNFAGYQDRDFSASNYTAFGPYLRMRFKFDQESVREAAAWINKQ